MNQPNYNEKPLLLGYLLIEIDVILWIVWIIKATWKQMESCL